MRNSLNSITKHFRRFRYGKELRPSRDWLVLLALTLLLMLGSLGWNLWQFEKVTSGEAIGVEAPPPIAETVPLTEVLGIFERRSLEETRYQNEYRFVDPSR